MKTGFSIVQCTQVGSKTVCRATIHLVVIVLNFAIEEKQILIDIIDYEIHIDQHAKS